MLLLIIMVFSFVGSIQCMEGSFLASKFKRTKQDLEYSQAPADMIFLRMVYEGQPAMVLGRMGTVAQIDAKALLTNDIELPLRGQSALSVAVRRGHTALAALMIARGANVHQQYEFGGNLLLMAVQHALDIPMFLDDWQLLVNERMQMVQLLLTQCASLRDQDGVIGYTPLHQCAECVGHKDLKTQQIGKDVCEKLLVAYFLAQQNTPDIKALTNELVMLCFIPAKDGQTPLDKACSRKCLAGAHRNDCAAQSLLSIKMIQNIYEKVIEIKVQPARRVDE